MRAIGDIERARTARPRRGSAELLARALRLPDAGDGRIIGAHRVTAAWCHGSFPTHWRASSVARPR